MELFAAEGPARLVRQGVDFDVDEDRLALGGHLIALRGLEGSYEDVFVPVHGSHLVDAAAVAVAAVEAFFERELPADVVEEAFAAVELPGRIEVAGHAPLVVLDGAHNPGCPPRGRHDAGRRVSRWLGLGSSWWGWSPAGIRMPRSRPSAPRPDLVICTSTEGDRGVAAQRLAAACDRAQLAHEVVAEPSSAVARAMAIADEADAVVVTGSFRLLAPARAAIRSAAQPEHP